MRAGLAALKGALVEPGVAAVDHHRASQLQPTQVERRRTRRRAQEQASFRSGAKRRVAARRLDHEPDAAREHTGIEDKRRHLVDARRRP